MRQVRQSGVMHPGEVCNPPGEVCNYSGEVCVTGRASVAVNMCGFGPKSSETE